MLSLTSYLGEHLLQRNLMRCLYCMTLSFGLRSCLLKLLLQAAYVTFGILRKAIYRLTQLSIILGSAVWSHG